MFGSQLNRIRKVPCMVQNFSANVLEELLSAPEELMGQAKFNGTRQEAIDFVTMRQVDRGHWNSQEKEYFYVKRAEALGVKPKGSNQHPTNVGSSVPSAKEHADALGVADRTVLADWLMSRALPGKMLYSDSVGHFDPKRY